MNEQIIKPDADKNPDILATLNSADYWEWRTSISEMDHAKTKSDLMHMKLKLLESEHRVRTLEMALFKTQVRQAIAEKEKLKKEYEDHKKRLEEKYKVSFDDCIIGEYNYEVKKIPREF